MKLLKTDRRLIDEGCQYKFDGDLVSNEFIDLTDLDKPLYVTGFIKANGDIKAGGDIEVNGFIAAGGSIKASGNIYAGQYIEAGDCVEFSPPVGPYESWALFKTDGSIEKSKEEHWISHKKYIGKPR